MTNRNAFTLVELLIVIAIILILAGLTFPAVNAALGTVYKVQAKNDAIQIATAITAFETEYGRLPLPTNTTINTAMVDILTGAAAGAADNPKRLVFIEAKARAGAVGKAGRSGTNALGYVDPWGGVYQVKMDTDYDNRIASTAFPSLSTAGNDAAVVLIKKVVVWNTNSTYKRRVRSWE